MIAVKKMFANGFGLLQCRLQNYLGNLFFYGIFAIVLPMNTSCLTVGNEFTSDVAWIIKDKTKRSEVELKIGAPFRTGYDTGFLTYTYGYYRYSIFKSTRTKDLTIRFNQDGTVNSYSFSSSFEEDKAVLSN